MVNIIVSIGSKTCHLARETHCHLYYRVISGHIGRESVSFLVAKASVEKALLERVLTAELDTFTPKASSWLTPPTPQRNSPPVEPLRPPRYTDRATVRAALPHSRPGKRKDPAAKNPIHFPEIFVKIFSVAATQNLGLATGVVLGTTEGRFPSGLATPCHKAYFRTVFLGTADTAHARR